MPYYFNSTLPTPVNPKDIGMYTGTALSLENVSGTGPVSYKNNDNYSAFAVYEKRLGDVFSFRLGSDGYANNSRSFNTTDTTSYDPDPTHFNSNPYHTPGFFGLTRVRSASSSYSAPSYKIDNKDGGGGQADLLAHYWMLDHAVENAGRS